MQDMRARTIVSTGMRTHAQKKEELVALKFLLPTLIVIGGLIFYPLIYNVYLSFHNVSLAGAKEFIGINNYAHLFQKRDFYEALFLTLQFLVFTVAGTTIVGLIVALVLNIDFFGSKVLQTIILLPYFAPVIAVIFGWQFIFDPVNGIYNYWVVEFFNFTNERRNILGNSSTSMIVIVLFNIWKYYPITYLMILAKLKSIDKNLYEAASIDGANRWAQFKIVTLPELQFTLGTVILLRFVWNLNRFEDVYLLSPDTNILSVFTYKFAFSGIPDQGLAAAISLVQLIIVGSIIWVYVKRILKW